MIPYISMVLRYKHYLFFILYGVIIIDFKILFIKKTVPDTCNLVDSDEHRNKNTSNN